MKKYREKSLDIYQ